MQKLESLSSSSQSDEIDLFELCSVLWSRKLIVIIAALVTIALAVAYLWHTSKVYEAKVYISEAQPADVALLNVGKEQLGQYAESVTSKSVYYLFQKNMGSRALAMLYFKSDVEPVYRDLGVEGTASQLLNNGFLNGIRVVKPGKASEYLTVSYEYVDPKMTFQWLNGYVQFVIMKTEEELVNAAKHSKVLAIDSYKKKMNSLRAIYTQGLQDQIIRLEEALGIAKKLGFKKSAGSNISEKVQSRELDESLMYMRGTEVLQAEIEALKGRSQVDPFISGIRPLQEKINYLESVTYGDALINIVAVDGWAEQPEHSIRPKKSLVLVLAGLLGGMLGVFIALIQWAVSNRKAVSE